MSGWGRIGAIALGAGGLATIAACGSAFESGAGTTGGVTGAGGATTSTGTGTGAGGAVTSTGAGGTVTSTGAGGSAGACEQGQKRACYTGPPGTEARGLCHAGEQACTTTGTWADECTGEVVPAAEECNTGVDANCDGVVCGQALGAIALGGPGADEITAVVVDAQGAVFVGGRTDGMMLGGVDLKPPPNERTLFVAKLDPDLQLVWARAIGSGPDLEDGGLEVRLALGPTGRVYVGGATAHRVDLGGTTKPVELADPATPMPMGFVGEISAADGGGVWVVPFTSDQDAYVSALAVVGQDVYVTGWACCSKLHAGGSDFGTKPYGGFVARFSDVGSLQGLLTLGDTAHVYPRAVTPWGAKAVAIAGYFADGFYLQGTALPHPGGNDGFLATFEPAGVKTVAVVGGTDSDALSGVAARSNGELVAVGDTMGSLEVGKTTLTSQGQDALLVRAGVDATPKNGWLFGDGKAQTARATVVGEDDHVYLVAENFGGKVTFAGKTLEQHGLVLALEKNDVPRWGRALEGTPRAMATRGQRLAVVGDFGAQLEAHPVPPIAAQGKRDGYVVVYAP